MPFAVAGRHGVLTLTLDTPGSPINIFNHATARQLLEILAAIDPSATRAIVFETAKRSSFINGVGLLLAQAARTYDDVVRASTPPWQAYRAVREAPVPTIAVVQGNCFGCGVEFILNCDYRIATDDGETRFYMTELNDYLFIPLFGSTWNLPVAVGLEAAIDLLLWGERWQAREAFAAGLVDAVIPCAGGEESKQRFVERVVHGMQPSRRRGRVSWGPGEDAAVERARRRIESLPPAYHKVYGEALMLLQAGALQTGTYDEHRGRELLCSAESALSAIGKAAYGFFYVRQMASERAAGYGLKEEPPLRVWLDGEADPGFAAFATGLRSRKHAGVAFVGRDTAEVRLVPARAVAECSPSGPGQREVAVCVSIDGGVPARGAAACLYAPLYEGGGRLIELAIPACGDELLGDGQAARLARVLQRCGFEVVRTTAREGFACDRFLAAYFSPLLAFVERGGGAGVVNASLREAGFVRRPHDLLQSVDRARLAQLLGGRMRRSPAEIEPLLASLASAELAAVDDIVLDALCIALLDAVLSAREGGEVGDLPTADVIARELLDFPRHLCSLCSWLKRERVARAVERDDRVRPLVSAAAYVGACSFVAGRRELYR